MSTRMPVRTALTAGGPKFGAIFAGLLLVLIAGGCIGENQEATSPDDFEIIEVQDIPENAYGQTLVLAMADVEEFDATDSRFDIRGSTSSVPVDIPSFTPGGHRYGYVRDYCFLEDVMVEYSDGSQDVLFEAGFCAEVLTTTIDPNQ